MAGAAEPADTAPSAGSTRPAPVAARGLTAWLPGARVLASYRRSWLRHDLTAGLVLTAFLVPVGMGYAEASGLPAVYGLYATIVPLLAYAVFGPSKILVLGPDSSLAPLIAATILPLSQGDPDRALALAGMLAIFTGAFLIFVGVIRFGYVTDLLSLPIRFGYLNGIALTVIVSQLPKLFGFSVEGNGFLQEAKGFLEGLANGETVWAAFAIGATAIVLVVGFRRWAPKVPGVLVAVVVSTVAVSLLGLADQLSVVGVLPRGLPSFAVPAVEVADLPKLAAAAVGIALVAFADTSVLSRTFAARAGEDVDPNREVVALGLANASAGLFQGFSISSSASRTPVAESAGAKTQLTGIVGAVAIALLLVVAPGLLRSLPQAALAGIVIVAATSLVEIRGVRRLFRIRPTEFWLSILCFLGVAILGVLPGIFVAIALAVGQFVQRAWRPHDAVLGRVAGYKGYHDLERHPEALQVPGLILYRWDAPLFFANAGRFHDRVLRAVRHGGPDARWIVVAAEPITDIDTTAATMLVDLLEDLEVAGVHLAFAELKGPVWDQLEVYGLTERIGEENRFPTLGTAVRAYVERTGTEWVDPNPD